MFGFFSRKQKKVKNNIVAPNTEIAYDPNLIEKLKSDHQQLLTLYGDIQQSADQSDYDSVRKILTEFRHTFHSHILLENVKLYIYLKHVLADSADSAAIAAGMRKEMGDIGKAVNQFVAKYTASDWTDEIKSLFPEELKKVGAILVERINMEEESLYVLYYPPDTY